MLWIPFTLFAALLQTIRNALQSHLSQEVSSLGVTLARFIYATPLAALYLLLLYQWQPVPLPVFSGAFIGTVLLAGMAQIIATVLMVRLFQQRNYAMGVGLAKSEAVIAATLGALFFHAPLSLLAWAGVLVGAAAIWLMSQPDTRTPLAWPTLLSGLGSGLAFALTTLWVRAASLMLPLPFLHSAAWVLLWVIASQAVLLIILLWQREPATLRALWQRPRLTLLISLCSFLGSFGWFTAMSLESVALVKTLGQVEVLFTLMISARWFKERSSRRELLGLGLIVLGALAVVLA